MDRKDFLKKGCHIGMLSACSPLLAGSVCSDVFAEDNKKGETPCKEKVDFAKVWIKRLMDVMDSNLDQQTREKIMFNNGQQCYRGANHKLKSENGESKLDDFIKMYRKFGGEDSIRQEGNTVYYSYVGNGKGVNIADGKCLCPIIEDGPEQLSKTYCQCSVGYVTEMFSDIVSHPVKVELKESLRSGGKKCSFVVHV